MTINIQQAIQWFKNKKGTVTYSMEQRDGEYSYDCSSAVYYALRFAGAISAGWAVNTEYMHDWLKKNGYVLIAENQYWQAQAGDIFIWGKRGQSAGAGGHTGMFIDENNIIHCNYASNGISINNHDERWAYAGKPYFYAYRLKKSNVGAATKNNGNSTQPNIKWEEWNGTVKVDKLNVRNAPSTSNTPVATYSKGERIYFDGWIVANGYRWGTYISYSGVRRYVAYRNDGTGEKYLNY